MDTHATTGRLAALGAYGFTTQEPLILAALVTGDPLLLIGSSGTGKIDRFSIDTLIAMLGHAGVRVQLRILAEAG